MSEDQTERHVTLDQTRAAIHYEGGPDDPGTCPTCGSASQQYPGSLPFEDGPRTGYQLHPFLGTWECVDDFHDYAIEDKRKGRMSGDREERFILACLAVVSFLELGLILYFVFS